MSNKIKAFSVALCAMLAGQAVVAQSSTETPVIEFHTTIYDTYGGTNSFSLVLGGTEAGVGKYIDIDCGKGSSEAILTVANYDTTNDESTGTFVTCNVSEEGIVKIYCDDPTYIDWFDATGCYIDWIKFNGTTEIDCLKLSHNELKSLDLSNMTRIRSLYVSDNPFSTSPLVIGPKPDMRLLEINNIGAISSDFNLSDYTNLLTFDAWNAGGLERIDASKCPGLIKLSIDGTNVSSIDLSGNPNLLTLNISDTRISQVDLSKCPNLQQLYCTHESSVNYGYKLKSLDVSKNPNLVYLFCTGNDLKTLDVTNNPNLGWLTARKNLLTEIDLSKNTYLTSLALSDNHFGFSTLPWRYEDDGITERYYEYYYKQREMIVDKSYAEGSEIDFSSKVLRDHTDTEGAMYAFNEADPYNPVLVPSTCYTYNMATGKVKINDDFIKNMNAYIAANATEHPEYATLDSVYMVFHNSVFSEYNLQTRKFKIKSAADYGKPNQLISMTTGASTGSAISFTIGVQDATPEQPKKFFVDFGDGTLKEFTATNDEPIFNNVNGTVAGSAIKVYGSDDIEITSFDIRDIALSAVDVTLLRSARHLAIVNASLPTINLEWNRCLKSLDLSHNKLSSSFTLIANNQDYGKNQLTDVDLSYNNISTFHWNENYTVKNFNIAHNAISALALSKNTMIESIDISYNAFTEFSCADCSGLTTLNVAGNKLSTITLPDESVLTNLNVSNNKFTLETLPSHNGLEEANYIYAPQAAIGIPTKAPGVNLAEQNRDNATTYTWRYPADDSEVPASHFSTAKNGQFIFASKYVGEEIYCAMTNTEFPAFTGANVLKTTVIETAKMPEYKIAEFTISPDTTAINNTVYLTMTSATANNTIYIDWTGNGNLMQYVLGTTYTNYYPTVTPGATVSVYAYSATDNITVFSLRNAKLSSFKLADTSFSKLICLNLTNAGLSTLDYPKSTVLSELILPGNNLTEFDFTRYPNLSYLNLTSNKLANLDLSNIGSVQQLFIGDNGIENINIGNSTKLNTLYANGNEAKSINLANLPNLEQLIVNDNKLTELNVSANPKLRVIYANDNLLSNIDLKANPLLTMLYISGNKFKFSTLPLESEIFSGKSVYTYDYTNQAKVQIECVNGVVDLSSEANVGGYATSFNWCIGEPDYDEYGTLTNECLEGSSNIEDNPEYLLVNGVTTFLTNPQSTVACVMTNDLFSKLTLETNLIRVNNAGVNDIAVDNTNINVKVMGNDIHAYANDGTIVNLYGINGTTMGTAIVANGEATFSNLTPGFYIVKVGAKVFKLAIK